MIYKAIAVNFIYFLTKKNNRREKVYLITSTHAKIDVRKFPSPAAYCKMFFPFVSRDDDPLFTCDLRFLLRFHARFFRFHRETGRWIKRMMNIQSRFGDGAEDILINQTVGIDGGDSHFYRRNTFLPRGKFMFFPHSELSD